VIGAGVYLASRREMSEVLHEAEEVVDVDDDARMSRTCPTAIGPPKPIDRTLRRFSSDFSGCGSLCRLAIDQKF